MAECYGLGVWAGLRAVPVSECLLGEKMWLHGVWGAEWGWWVEGGGLRCLWGGLQEKTAKPKILCWHEYAVAATVAVDLEAGVAGQVYETCLKHPGLEGNCVHLDAAQEQAQVAEGAHGRQRSKPVVVVTPHAALHLVLT